MKKMLPIGFILYGFTAFSQIDLSSDLKVCLPFTGNANDQSGLNNNGTVNGATLTTDRFSNANNAYQFNGTSDYISLANFSAIAPTNELTISMWAKSDVTTSNCLFMLSPDNPSDRCVGCAQYSNSGSTMMIWDYGNISGNGRTTVPSIPIDLSGWHHYVYIVSQSGNKKQMYLDGVSKSSVAYAGTCSNKNLPFYIGAGNDGGQGGNIRFRGKIDDVCIYNRALTAAEVTALNTQQNLCATSTNIEHLSSFSSGILYPAVSGDGIFSYSGDLSKLSAVAVYSIEGKLMTSLSSDALLNKQQIDLSSLDNGFYFVSLIKEGKTSTQKIVISR
jgi:hypothetical protein